MAELLLKRNEIYLLAGGFRIVCEGSRKRVILPGMQAGNELIIACLTKPCISEDVKRCWHTIARISLEVRGCEGPMGTYLKLFYN